MANDIFYFDTRQGIIKVNKKQILFIKADKRYSTLFLEDNSVVQLLKGLTEIENILTDNKFVRSHRKFLANMNNAIKFDKQNNTLIMSNNTKIPISVRRKSLIVNNYFQN